MLEEGSQWYPELLRFGPYPPISRVGEAGRVGVDE